jgi:hypothetical protein
LDQSEFVISRPPLGTDQLFGITGHCTIPINVPGFGKGILVSGGLTSGARSFPLSFLDVMLRMIEVKLVGSELPQLTQHAMFTLANTWEFYMLSGIANDTLSAKMWMTSVYSNPQPQVRMIVRLTRQLI